MLGEQKEIEKQRAKKGGKGSKNKSKRYPDKPLADVSTRCRSSFGCHTSTTSSFHPVISLIIACSCS